MFDNGSYRVKPLKFSGLHGISDRNMEMHFKLYEGYAKETNRLMERFVNRQLPSLLAGAPCDAFFLNASDEHCDQVRP